MNINPTSKASLYQPAEATAAAPATSTSSSQAQNYQKAQAAYDQLISKGLSPQVAAQQIQKQFGVSITKKAKRLASAAANPLQNKAVTAAESEAADGAKKSTSDNFTA